MVPDTWVKICGFCAVEFTTKNRHTRFCCKSCSLKHRYTDPNYAENIRKKSAEKRKTWSDEYITEIHRKIREKKSGREKEISENISAGIRSSEKKIRSVEQQKTNNRLLKDARRKNLAVRLQRILDTRGHTRSVFKLFYQFNERTTLVASLFAFIRKLRSIGVEVEASDEDFLRIWIDKNLKRNCHQCDSLFSHHVNIVDARLIVRNVWFCSDACRGQRLADPILREKLSERSKRFWQREDYRKSNSEGTRRRHAADSTEKKNAIAAKRRQTNLERDPDYYKNWGRRCMLKKLENGFISSFDDEKLETEYTIYKKEVQRYTKRADIKTLEGYGYRSKRGMHLDHKFPIILGFFYGIPPELIGDLDNLEFLSAQENQTKQGKYSSCSDAIEAYIRSNNITLNENHKYRS
jgi:hypothetical protein